MTLVPSLSHHRAPTPTRRRSCPKAPPTSSSTTSVRPPHLSAEVTPSPPTSSWSPTRRNGLWCALQIASRGGCYFSRPSSAAGERYGPRDSLPGIGHPSRRVLEESRRPHR